MFLCLDKFTLSEYFRHLIKKLAKEQILGSGNKANTL